jgi:Flp pilus assembly protein TadG
MKHFSWNAMCPDGESSCPAALGNAHLGRSGGLLSRLKRKCRLLREETGGALVEAALCMSIFGLPLLVGTVELGTMMFNSIEVTNAAHAGASYGMISATFAAHTSGIIAAAQGEAPEFGTNLNVTPTVYFACSESAGGSQYSSSSAATTACTGGTNHALEFIQVTTSATVTPPIKCPGLPATYTLTGVSVMEVQE